MISTVLSDWLMRLFWQKARELRVLCTICRAELSQYRGGPCALCDAETGVGA